MRADGRALVAVCLLAALVLVQRNTLGALSEHKPYTAELQTGIDARIEPSSQSSSSSAAAHLSASSSAAANASPQAGSAVLMYRGDAVSSAAVNSSAGVAPRLGRAEAEVRMSSSHRSRRSTSATRRASRSPAAALDPIAAEASSSKATAFLILGVANAPKNAGHRSWIRQTWMQLPNVVAGNKRASSKTVRQERVPLVRAFFLVGVLTSDGTAQPRRISETLNQEQAVYGDIAFLNARETKPPGEKMIGFFRMCVVGFPNATFCVKTDDDTYVHTLRLALNMEALWGSEQRRQQTAEPLLYLGATLWASYLPEKFEVCGHGMGPLMAVGASRTERCGERGGVGPFPYAAGTLEVLSMPLALWLTQQLYVARFVQRAHATNPPAWNIGEDTVLGMWVHQSPYALTALHWGWDKIHDLCFKCTDKTQLWKPITTESVVVHIKGHQANENNFLNVHRNFSRVCDDACQRVVLPFDVPSLAHLCRRSEIGRAYSKCRQLASELSKASAAGSNAGSDE